MHSLNKSALIRARHPLASVLTSHGAPVTLRCVRSFAAMQWRLLGSPRDADLQFADITQVLYPPVYKRFLEVISLFTFDLGWIVSASCLASGITFYDKLMWVLTRARWNLLPQSV